MGSWRHSANKWRKRSTMRDGGPDDQVRPWIRGFVDMVGEKEAKVLLEGAGILTNCKDWSANSTDAAA